MEKIQEREVQLNQFLRLEIARKGQISTISFMIFSLLVFFSPFGTIHYKTIIQTTAIISILALIWRYFLFADIRKKNMVTDSQWLQMKLVIWINSIVWSIILNLSALELKFNGFDFIIVTTLTSGIVGASIVTLSYYPILFIPFQVLILFPHVFILIYLAIYENLNSTPLIILYLMYLIYQLKQSKVYRQELIKVFNYQYDLEITNKKLISQTAKLMHTSRLAALGEMSASIAHEVNNPLMVINGSLNQLDRALKKDVIEMDFAEKLIQRIKKSTERVSIILGGLRHFANQSDELPKQDTKLESIINETTGYCTELVNANFIKLECQTPPQVIIHCHAVQISQVLINLIKNAVDALIEKNETQPTINQWIKLQYELDKNNLIIKVINSGEKISDEVAEKIFQPFFTTKASGKGTGLGLSISSAIIQEHQGQLSLDHSNENTAFIIQLPIVAR